MTIPQQSILNVGQSQEKRVRLISSLGRAGCQLCSLSAVITFGTFSTRLTSLAHVRTMLSTAIQFIGFSCVVNHSRKPALRLRLFAQCVLALAWLCCMQPIAAQPSLTAPAHSDTMRTERKNMRSAVKELQNDIDGLLKSRDFSNAMIGVSVLSADNGETLYKENDAKNFIPASTLKLFTTSAALDYLGKEFRYSTRLYLDGKISPGGEFQGNVILRGSGDPTWSEFFKTDVVAIFDTWMTKFDSLGIKSINGNIIGDDSYFDKEHYASGWSWDDMAYPYSAQISALSASDNSVEVQVFPGSMVGEQPRIVIAQDYRYVRIINNLTTGNANEGTEIVPVRIANTNTIELRGHIALEGKASNSSPYSLRVAIDNPSLFVLHILKQAFEHHQIKVRGLLLDIENWNERISYAGMQALCEHVSPRLQDIVAVVNTHSHNLCAESLLKTLGKESSGVGSFDAGIESVKKYITRLGIQHDDFQMEDGSGLSRLNLCSPQQLAQLLWAVHKSEIRQEFEASLAVPGESGTMRNRTVGTLAEKRVKAKTGSLNNVCTLAGYVSSRDGETLCFAIMINNFTAPEALARNLQDLICMRLATFSRKS